MIKRSALDNSVLVRFTVAFLFTALSEWAFFIGALVYAFDHGGARATGFSSLALLAPIALAAPMAGKVATHRRPDRVRLAAFTVQAVALSAAAAAAFADAPVVLVTACCAIASGAYTFLGPASAVMLPTIVRSTRELTVANVWVSSCESVSNLGGSAMATLLLALQGPALLLAVCAGLNVTSTVISASRRSATAAAPASTDPDVIESTSAAWVLLRSVKLLRDRKGAIAVLAVAGGQNVLVGAFDLIIVVLAKDALDLGQAGPGLLATSVGVGALISAVASTFLVRRPWLAPLLIGALGSIVIVTVVLGMAPALATALVLLPVAGFSRSLLDLTSRMLLQRSTPPQALAAVFGAIELSVGTGLLLGAALAQVLIAIGGVETALIGVGAFFVLLLVLTVRSLLVADDSADIPVVAIGLLRKIPAFAALPPLALETVARAATEVSVETGHAVVTEGEQGDQYYAVADGSFDITIGGQCVRTAERGAGFGEVALLANVPRTVTVTANRPGSLLAIQREPFLAAVTGSESARRAAWGTVRTLGVHLDVDVDD